MPGDLVVRPDKNEFLLYSMLDSRGLIGRNHNSHFLRREAKKYFQYRGERLRAGDYFHYSKPVSYVLTLNEAPDFSRKRGLEMDEDTKRDVKLGSVVLPYLEDFYEHSGFDRFYSETLPIYEKECGLIRDVVKEARLKEVLEDAWESDDFDAVVIPMPLERLYFGIGPNIGNVSYSIIGPPFNPTILHLLAHELSHPKAKRTLEPVMDEIDKRAAHLVPAMKNRRFPEIYSTWRICFEEHFIRAMQETCVDPKIVKAFEADGMGVESAYKGMVYLDEFAYEIEKYKLNKSGTLQDVAVRILERLDRRRKPPHQIEFYELDPSFVHLPSEEGGKSH